MTEKYTLKAIEGTDQVPLNIVYHPKKDNRKTP
jgi:hypothetical protein